jgi:CheY-like chemotaxis protein
MEISIVLVLAVLLVAVKGLTGLWLGKTRSAIRSAQSQAGEVQDKLKNVEAAKLQLERDKQAQDHAEKLLENEKDLVSLEIKKFGGEPVPEDELDAMDAVKSLDAGGEGGEKEEESEGEKDAEESEPEAPKGNRYKILVVDDNAELREVLEKVLSRKYEVVGAEDGYDALSKIVKDKLEFDLLITDLKMPNVNGFTLVEKLKKLPKKLPTIIISGFLQQEEFQKAVADLEPAAVFQKPFKMAEIRKAIEKTLKE